MMDRLPVLLFVAGLTALSVTATVMINWLLGAFPASPAVDAIVALAALVATIGVGMLLVASFLMAHTQSADPRRGFRA